MAKFTASVPLKIRLPGGFEIDGAVGATHRIPDALVDEFARDQAPLIPGFAWVTQDETTGLATTAAITTQIDAHSISASAHSHFARTDNPHSASSKQVSQVFSSTDLSIDTVITLPGGIGDSHMNSVAYDGATIVTGTYSAGNIWVSRDQGMTWEGPGKLNGITAIDDIAWLMSDRPGQFWAGCSSSGAGSRLFRSTDSGSSWLQVMQSATSQATEGLSLCGGFGRVLLAGSGQNSLSGGARIWRSTDNGDQWTIVSSTETSKTSIRQICHVSNGVYIAGAYGASPNESKIYRSIDTGSTWSSAQTLASTDVYSMLALPNGVALLGTYGATFGHIYRSTDIGASFSTVAAFGGSGSTGVFGLLRMGGKVLAFVNENGNVTSTIYVSSDAGLTWAQIGSLDALFHPHMPVAVDDRTIIVPLSRNGYAAAGKIARINFYG